MGSSMRSFDWPRFGDLLDRGVPDNLAETASKHRVWKRVWNNVTMAWLDRQDDKRIADQDWIEYIPDPVIFGYPVVTPEK